MHLFDPFFSIKNRKCLLKWWRKVKSGHKTTPPPKESDIFKSDSYSSFVYLFFKIATEVNVFAHLGSALFAHVKENILLGKTKEDDETYEDFSDDSSDDNRNSEEDVNGSLFNSNMSSTVDIGEI